MKTFLNLSILIPAYNVEKYIQECIESIWEQNYNNMEIIVVDDCSTDNTFDILKQLQKKSPVTFKLFRNKSNLGAGASLNKALEHAEGEFITFIDPDDKFLPDAFKKRLEHFNNYPTLQLVYSNGLVWDGKKTYHRFQGKKEIQFLKKNDFIGFYEYVTSNVPNLLLQGLIVKKELLIKINGFDPRIFSNDWLLNIKMFKYLSENYKNYSGTNKKVVDYINEDVFLYRQHENNITNNIDKLYWIIYDVIRYYIPENKKRCLLAELNWRHGKRLLKFKKSINGIKFMIDGILKCPEYIIRDIYTYTIKGNLKDLWKKKHI